MGFTMVKVGMLFFCLLLGKVHAGEFKHIKLNPEFEKFLTTDRSIKPSAAKFKSNSGTMALSAQNGSVLNATFDTAMRAALLGSQNTAPLDGEESLLYREIRDQLEASHQQIGIAEVARINQLNSQFNLGTENYSGFSWQKPFGAVQIWVDRQVIPNLLSEGPADVWYVQDSFNIDIEATTFLEKLKDAGLSNMSDLEIGAFAGISFKRVYTYIHFAPSYQAGLQSDFSKLFLPFLSYNLSGLEKMDHQDIIKRNDQWSAKAGGLITTPSYYGATFSAGVLAQATFDQTTSIQSFKATDDTTSRFEVGVLTKDSKSAGATLELQLEFFNFLKLSLLRADLTYEYSDSKKFTLAVKNSDWTQIQNDQAQVNELKSLLGGKSEIKTLEPYVVTLEESASQGIDVSGSALLWGRMQKTKTEQKRIIKDGQVTTFFRSYAQSTKYVQSLLSRLISAVVYNLLKLPIGAKNVAIYSKLVTMEHKATTPQAENPGILRIEKAEDFSFTLIQSYEANRTHKKNDSGYKNDIIWFVDEFTTLPKGHLSLIRNNKIQGPIRAESNLKVNHEGFLFFAHRPVNELFNDFARVCKSSSKQEWINEKTRAKKMTEKLSGPDGCVRVLGEAYLAFKDDYMQNELKPSLVKFKTFLTKYYKVTERVTDLYAIFGQDYTFLSGYLSATYPGGGNFKDHFSNGKFRGNGVIDNFIRGTGSRTPASVQNE